MKKIIVLILLCVSTLTIKAHPDGYVPNDSLYRASFQQIKEMLEGKRMFNFKEAVFITENAYLNGAIDREFFEMNIQILALLAQEIARQEHLKYQYEDSINIRKNWGITRVLTDSFYLKMYGHNVEWRPTSYNFEDPLGEKDWTNTFVSKLFWTSKGNCHSLPFLYKILAEELGAEAFLSLAPSHLYLQIPCKNRKIGSYNLELTSKSHPTTGLIVANSYISLEAIQAGLYMNKLSLKESIALTLLDLAQGYQKKFPKASEDFILECIKTVLEHFPNCVNAQLLKVEILAKKYQRTKDVLTFAELNQTCNWLISNGYDEMPKEMYAEGLTSSNPYEHLSPKYKTANKEGLTPYFDAKTATVGNGKYLETHSTETLEHIGSVIYNTQTKQVETIQDYQRIGDLTMNPSLVGRFLSVDPLSPSYPWYTPYQFAGNKPIWAVDLDGLEEFISIYEYNDDDNVIFVKTVRNTEFKDGKFYNVKTGKEFDKKEWGTIQYEYIKPTGEPANKRREMDGSFSDGEGDIMDWHIYGAWKTIYTGSNNPDNIDDNGNWRKDYRREPINDLDYAALKHDEAYDELGDIQHWKNPIRLEPDNVYVKELERIAFKSKVGEPGVTGHIITKKEKADAFLQLLGMPFYKFPAWVNKHQLKHETKRPETSTDENSNEETN